MKHKKFRKAFSMVTAIFLIVLMATVAIFVMNLSGKIIKSTTTQYQHEQAELYTKSYTEYAILAVTGNDRSTNCLQTVTGTIGSPTTGNGYRIRTHIAYIGSAAQIGTCAGGTRQLNNNDLATAETPLTIIIDAYVDYQDPENAGANSPWLTVHRRTVQKI